MTFKTILALIVTMALAAAAVFFGAQQDTLTNAVKLKRPNGYTQQNSTRDKDAFLDRFVEKDQTVSAAVQKDEASRVEAGRQSTPQDLTEILATLTKQADRITMPNLRDQAYIDITNFSLHNGLFVDAYAAMKSIKQVELRDTSRGQIAIGLARHGQVSEAFNVIDQVETDGLRDVLRLQVIEAITIPQNMTPQNADTGLRR